MFLLNLPLSLPTVCESSNPDITSSPSISAFKNKSDFLISPLKYFSDPWSWMTINLELDISPSFERSSGKHDGNGRRIGAHVSQDTS